MNLVRNLGIFAAIVTGTVHGQTTWVGLDTEPLWDFADNWSAGVPVASSAVIFDSATGVTGIQDNFTIASLTFQIGVGEDQITNVIGGALTINGAITNNSPEVQTFDLTVNAGANATWDGPLAFVNIVNVGTRQITLSGSHTFSGESLNFDITNTSIYGRFLGSGSTTYSNPVTINVGGSYSGGGVVGDTFDLTSGSFTGATIGTLPALSGGLVWNRSNFLSSGLLTVSAIPEPAVFGMFMALGAVGFAGTRRRRRSFAQTVG